ncbi:MAG: manganese ABC transporter ATP-binding protein [Gemmatimonadetes bacterium]|nr:manganese ABC transporter ATP-binding protein [Gemmatimonadota bacterium]
MKSADPIVEVDGMSVEIGSERVLRSVSLTVERGSCHCIVGPNGAGKSTLLAALLGRVEFGGSARIHWRGDGRIGFVPQRTEIEPSVPITACEFLALGRSRRPVFAGVGRRRRREIAYLLERVGLPSHADLPLSGLSGGELQRLLLANAIDPMPELLIMDEPTAGLDIEGSDRFEAVLANLRDASAPSILMVSHDLAQVHRLADEVTVLDRKVLQRGAPGEALAGIGGGGVYDFRGQS